MCRLIGERGISCNRRNEQVSKILLNKEKCRALLWEGRIVLGKVGRRAYIAIGSINLCVCLLHNTDFTIAYMLHNFSCQIGGADLSMCLCLDLPVLSCYRCYRTLWPTCMRRGNRTRSISPVTPTSSTPSLSPWRSCTGASTNSRSSGPTDSWPWLSDPV